MANLGQQFVTLLLLALPVACLAWSVTHEEIFREPREWCVDRSKHAPRFYQRKFFYIFTCEYCFSHYVSALFIALTGFQILLRGWRGYFLAWLGVVWIANMYMSLFGRLRLEIKYEHLEIAATEGGAPVKPKLHDNAPKEPVAQHMH